VKVQVEVIGAGTSEDKAEALVQALLLSVRELRRHNPDRGKSGTYTLAATLNENDSWYWSWKWFERSDQEGTSAGKIEEE